MFFAAFLSVELRIDLLPGAPVVLIALGTLNIIGLGLSIISFEKWITS